jgi:acyl-[acyl-carrier-protein]-phospholipid O-acyltransferase/long-chain-fatty-acid--[acyl-carrier-protein] ligase
MAEHRYLDILTRRGFCCFFWTQFLGAFNDNLYKIIVSFVVLDMVSLAGSRSFYISLIGLLFILPFALFSAYAGQLADIYSKRSVLIAVKVFEIAAMGLGCIAFFYHRIELMLAVVFLMGLHSTFFSPAKYGILPEMLPEQDLSRGNGLLEMSTFLAIILGTSLGGVIYATWKDHLAWVGVLLMLIALLGTLTSLGITKVPPSGATKVFTPYPWTEIWDGVKRLYGVRALWLTVMGISYFWFLGAMIQMDILLFGKEILRLDEARIGLLGTFLAIGIGAGSLAAGRLSGDRIELGLVPLGSVAMGAFPVLLYFSPADFAWVSVLLILMGFSAGLFIVPLNALLQQRSGKEEKGRLIATNNFLNTMGVLLASGFLWSFSDVLGWRSDQIILVLGILTFILTAYALYVLPDFVVRFVLWLLTHTLYRIRVVGQQNIPNEGPALLVSNHVSFADALIIGACIQRFIRFMLHRDYYKIRGLCWLFQLMKSIPVSNTRRGIVESLRRARQEIEAGQVVCIFAEGAISRTGRLLPFKRGFEKIVEGTSVPIIPVHLDQLWGSVFSFKNGRFFWKWPKHIPHPVTVSFGTPLSSTASAHDVRQAVSQLESNAFAHRRKSTDLLHTKFIRVAKRRWFSFCMADTTGTQLNYGKTLIASLLLSQWIERKCANDRMIGVMLPASVGGALANIAILLAGKTAVNLNFTAGPQAVASAVQQCRISTILTSRLFLSRAGIEQLPGMVFLEDVRKTFALAQKMRALLVALIVPGWWLQRGYGKKQSTSDLATVIFSSGSTGAPKGVMLSHHNIVSNIESICQVIQFKASDRIMGVLPFFHSFGFTATIWLPLLAGFGAVYHPNPTDAKTIGETVQKYNATLLISTPTFFAGYIRRCSAQEFRTLRYAIAGAEKLRESIAQSFKEKYGLDLLEGYGCTELSPVVSVNIPDVAYDSEKQIGNKPGTVGHPIPGVAVRVVDLETGQPVPCGQEGLLLVKGPNRMLGYLGSPELTAQAIRNGWYVTGDVASIDEDGFIRITDRVSRFSKIGGEMVPHTKVEEAINAVLGNPNSVVVSLPDAQKGERLVAFYAHNGVTAEQLWHALNSSGLPKLWIPKKENLYWIESIPLLGSGKVDLKKIKAIAAERAAAAPGDTASDG